MATSRERPCPHKHDTILDAIQCAERNLGVRGIRLQPYWGSTTQNAGLIVGFQLTSRIRWRLDYDATRGIHVNEEHFDRPPHLQKVVHIVGIPAISGELQVFLQHRKWTNQVGQRPEES